MEEAEMEAFMKELQNMTAEQRAELEKLLEEHEKGPKPGEIDEKGGMIITPKPAFVVKTFDNKVGTKVFINICTHEIVDMPEEKELPDQEEDHIGLRVPLSLGPPRQEKDKRGKSCTVYDTIVNPEIVERIETEPRVRQVLIELCVTHIKEKHNEECSLKYKLPKLKYKGKTVLEERVRAKKDPKIEVVDKEVFEKPMETTRTPEWKIYLDGNELDCENVEIAVEFRIVVKLELLVSAKAILLEASPEMVEVSVGRLYYLRLFMPFLVDGLEASFDCESRELSVIGRIIRETVSEEVNDTVQLRPVVLSSHEFLEDIV